MKRRHRIALAGAGAFALPFLLGYLPLVGCAGADDDRGGDVPDGAPADVADASSTLDRDPPDDGGTDAGEPSDASDGSVEADAGPRCTAGGWCYTELPVTDAGAMSLTDVWATQDEAWAVTSAGHVLHWKNDAWSIVFDAGIALAGVRRDHEGTVWAVGNAGTILRHSPGKPETEWSLVSAGTGGDLVAICEGAIDASSPQNLWIAGKQTILLRWTGDVQGDSPIWSYFPLGPIEIRATWCSQQDVWAVGLDFTNNGSALYSGTNGAFTKLSGLPATRFARPFSGVWASSASDIWMADITKVVHGGGDPPSWETYDVGDWHFGSPTDWDFWGTTPNDVWLVGRRGRIYHYDGTKLELSLTSIDGVLMTNNLHGISGASSDDLWVVGDDIALHRKTKN